MLELSPDQPGSPAESLPMCGGESCCRACIVSAQKKTEGMISCHLTLIFSPCLHARLHFLLHPTTALFRQDGFSVGGEVPLPRPRIQVAHERVPRQCAG